MKEKNGGEGEEAGPDLHHGRGWGGWLRGAEEGKRFLHQGNEQ